MRMNIGRKSKKYGNILKRNDDTCRIGSKDVLQDAYMFPTWVLS